MIQQYRSPPVSGIIEFTTEIIEFPHEFVARIARCDVTRGSKVIEGRRTDLGPRGIFHNTADWRTFCEGFFAGDAVAVRWPTLADAERFLAHFEDGWDVH